jgi:hypothetical protein
MVNAATQIFGRCQKAKKHDAVSVGDLAVVD